MDIHRRPSGGRPAEPVDPVQAALDSMRRAGADPAVPHQTRHFIYIPGVRAAHDVARAVKKPGREVEIDTSARKGYWLVVVSEPMLVTPETIAAHRSEFEAAAAPVGGQYDRWQVDVAG